MPTATSTSALPTGSGAPAVGRVLGSATIRRGNVVREVTAGFRLLEGDEVSTQDRGVVIEFDGGSKIQLGPRSGFTVSPAEPNTLKQELGRIIYTIDRRGVLCLFDPKCARPFTVRAGPAAGSVRGTVFTVDLRDDGSVRWDVAEGVVAVQAGAREVEVGAGSSIVVRPGEELSGPVPTDSIPASGTARQWSPAALAAGGAAVLIAIGSGGLWITTRRRSRAGG